MTEKRYIRENGVRKVCSYFGLEDPLKEYDDREFKIENGKVVLL
ncbi:MAG: hypothetical protein AABY07_11260 [Nanoarchaeota archaeon]